MIKGFAFEEIAKILLALIILIALVVGILALNERISGSVSDVGDKTGEKLEDAGDTLDNIDVEFFNKIIRVR